MKIGILTFHRAHNYGAVLQTYALQEFLRSIGHEVHVIDYKPIYFDSYRPFIFRDSFCINPLRFFSRIIKNILIYRVRKSRYLAFDKFLHNRLNLFDYNKNSDLSIFDCIVLGSDQIWNKKITGGSFDDLFLGLSINTKVVSYAASAGNDEYTGADYVYLQKSLSHMSKISVREESLCRKLMECTNIPISVVVDPVFLVDVSAFLNISKSEVLDTHYVLSYDLTSNMLSYERAERIAKDMNLRHIHISGSVFYKKRKFMNLYNDVSPESFLSLFRNASYVVTSSFHGTAFSIIFKKQFVSVYNDCNVNKRIKFLLEQLGLEDRNIFWTENFDFGQIDYVDVYGRCSFFIKSSRDFLKQI